MKFKYAFLVLLLPSIFAFTVFQNDSNTKSLSKKEMEIKQKVAKTMAKMTLQDKVGEMTQLTIDMVCIGQPFNLEEPHRIDEAKLKHALVDLRVGSILNCGGHAYTREHWHKLIGRIQEVAMKEKPGGIPILYGVDAIHGANYTIDATLFPQQIAMAATWNPALVEEAGRITAYETKASGIPWNFSPVLDIGRDARWPRLWETFGEDVLLASEMGEALVKGYQGEDPGNPYQVASTMKHFLGYSTPWSGKDRTPAYIPEVVLQEYFVPTFKKAIEANAKTIMINSGEINGIPVHCNPKILKDLLRDQLGFKGLAVTDWEDIKFLVTRHRVAKTYKDAIAMAINAGIDMSMVPIDLEYTVLLKELVEEKRIPMSRIDEAVERILTLKHELDLFEHPMHPLENYPDFASKKHSDASYRTAIEAITLLKNKDNILPLSKNKKVLVTGPTAHSLNAVNGGWTGTWQGTDEKYNTKGKRTIVEAMQDLVGKDKVTYVEGCSFDKPTDLKAVKTAAQNVDVVFLCLGEMPYTEKPGDIVDLNLPKAQHQLLEMVKASGKDIVLVLAEGRPRIVSDIEPDCKAVMMTYLSGNETGRALASLIYGDEVPSGKLPFTYPRYANDLVTYDHKGTEKIDIHFGTNAFNPQWHFGDGLSYTNFKYDNLRLNTKTFSKDGTITITVNVKNTGKIAAKETVQLFIADKVASVTPPEKRLRAFEKITLDPSEAMDVSFEISAKDLSFVGIDGKWVTELGEFEVQMKHLKAIFEYK